MKPINIVLDFGHGGLDKDCNYTTAPYKMHKFSDGEVAYEGEINRQIGGFLKLFLNMDKRFNVITTVGVEDPRDLSLRYRVRVANSYDPSNTIMVSIHCNASRNHNARGFEIFTSVGHTKSDNIAEHIYDEVCELYEQVNLRMRHDFSDGDSDKEADFYVLRKTKCPAVLLECLFFDNREDYNNLIDANFQLALAKSFYDGLVNYISQK